MFADTVPKDMGWCVRIVKCLLFCTKANGIMHDINYWRRSRRGLVASQANIPLNVNS